MSDSPSFFAELQRRHVIRAAIAHVIVAWLFIQFADVVLPYIGIVDEAVRWSFVISVATFPITLIIAWFFEHPWHKYTGSRLAMDVIVITAVAIIAGTWAVRNIPDIVRIKTSIAVLPFKHEGNPLEQGVSRAIAYEVNSLLLKSKSIDVIGFESATSSVLAGLGTVAVADRLGVQHVLAGEVSVLDNLMRIDLRLLDSAGVALWDAAIEDSIDNLYLVQERIAVAVESRLGAGEDVVPVTIVAANRCWMPNDPSALEKYYTARYYVELRTDTKVSQQQMADAIVFYRELIDEYPDFAAAHSGLAWAYLLQGTYDPERALPGNERIEESDRLAAAALALCPTFGEAMHLLPNQFDHENGWIGDYQQLTAFIEMQPDQPENYQRLARHFRDTGLNERAIEVSEQNYATNPLSPKSVNNLASAYQYERRHDEAIELFELAAELGSTGQNYALMMKQIYACGLDPVCRTNAFPPYMESLKGPMLVIMTAPDSDETAPQPVDTAFTLFGQAPYDTVNILNVLACEYEHLGPDFYFELWDRNQALGEDIAFWFWPNLWSNNCESVWSDSRFSDFAKENGFVEYWQEVGFPPGFSVNADGKLVFEGM
jgi:TolB-like protein/TPR repeat protein